MGAERTEIQKIFSRHVVWCGVGPGNEEITLIQAEYLYRLH